MTYKSGSSGFSVGDFKMDLIPKALKDNRLASKKVRELLGLSPKELDGVSEELAREAFTLAAAKLPLATKFISRETRGIE